MFRNAVKIALNYVRPLATGHLFYKDFKIINGISTLIVLNKNGDILTCAHNANLFLISDETNEVFSPILKEINDAKPKDIKKIEKKYGIEDDTLVALHNIIIDISENPGKLKIIKHPYLDLAIIKLENNKNLIIDKYPIFSKKEIEIGTSICKIGFAFPEYNTFEYDKENCRLKTTYKFMNFPIFPLDGIITRNVTDENEKRTMFETSSIVLPGQTGGPVLNKEGLVLGMMFDNKTIKYNDTSISLGLAINSDTIIKFLTDNSIEFEER